MSSMTSGWNNAVRTFLLKINLVPQSIHGEQLTFIFECSPRR